MPWVRAERPSLAVSRSLYLSVRSPLDHSPLVCVLCPCVAYISILSNRFPEKTMTVSNQTVELREEHLLAARTFAETFPNYLQMSETIQAVVRDLVRLFNDPNIGEEERQRVLQALAATLTAAHHERTGNGVGREKSEETPEKERVREELDREETLFAANLKQRMQERNLIQAELAERVGLSQPAVSMLLARKYRPQRRTVRLIAQILGVEAGTLWPGLSAQPVEPSSAEPKGRRSANGVGPTG